MRHYIIPIFIPELACPNRCIYCNQRYISGQINQPEKEEIIEKINSHLSTFKPPYEAEIAFFGGSFTGIEPHKQIEYLEIIQPYIKRGEIESIRLSTRPDYINESILQTLKDYNVKTIELGAQSLCQDVLDYAQRGHRVEDVENASKLIIDKGFDLGLQMMIGLPKDSVEKSILSAEKIVSLGAKSTRIYPTLVIENTELANLYRKGDYIPLELDDAVIWAAKIYKIFYNNHVKILRVGLHPSESLINKTELLAGAFHVSFRELVLTEIFKQEFEQIKEDKTMHLIITTNSKSKNYAIGHKSSNRDYLQAKFNHVSFQEDPSLKELEFNYNLSK